MFKFKYVSVSYFILSVNILVCSTTSFIGTAHHMVHFTDKILNQNLQNEFSVRSVIECMSFCMKTTDCKSFFYNTFSFRCRLHSVVFTTTTGATAESGSMYLILFDVDTSPIDLRSLCRRHSHFIYIESFSRNEDFCFRHSINDNLPFEEARTNCSESGGRLLQLETDIKIAVFTSLLNNDFNYGSVWFGATLLNHSTWVWNFDINNPINNFNWATNEPLSSGNCVKLIQSANYKWGVRNCNTRKRFVCEIVTMM